MMQWKMIGRAWTILGVGAGLVAITASLPAMAAPDRKDASVVMVARDRDRDGVRNRWDRDRDGDGLRNRRDRNPNGVSTRRDLDRDGITNRRDRDRDGDGIPNTRDRRPNVRDTRNGRQGWNNGRSGVGWGTGRNRASGYANDLDRDGITNSRDHDRDGDGVRNERDRHPNDARRR